MSESSGFRKAKWMLSHPYPAVFSGDVCVFVVTVWGLILLVVYVLIRMAALSPSHSSPAGWRLHAL